MAETRTKSRSSSAGKAAGAAAGAAANGDGATEQTVCNVAFCPICMVVTAAQGAAPETVEHLLKAAREFFFAARAIMDVRADHLAGERPAGPTRLEKIDIA